MGLVLLVSKLNALFPIGNCQTEIFGNFLQMENAPGDKAFPVLVSRTSGLHVCSRDVSIHYMGRSWRLFTSGQDFVVSNGQSKKFKLIQKSHVPRALRFSCQGPTG